MVDTLPKRTDSDVLLKELKLKFGDKEYVIPVLRMRQAAKWRQAYFEKTQGVFDSVMIDDSKPMLPSELSKAVSRGLMGALQKFPEKVPELVFSYANQPEKEPLLPTEEILDIAYDQDFQRAFAQIWQVAFAPFLASLSMVLEMQRAQASPSRSPAGLN